MSDKTLQMAQALRGWEAKHPVLSTALSFVPVAGQAYGLASSAAAMRDPEASGLEKGLAAASVTPLGGLAKMGKKGMEMIGGPEVIKRLRAKGRLSEEDLQKRIFQSENKRASDYGYEKPGVDDLRIELPDPDIDYEYLIRDLEDFTRHGGGRDPQYLRKYMLNTPRNRGLVDLIPELADIPKIVKMRGEVSGGAYNPNSAVIQTAWDKGRSFDDKHRAAKGTTSHEIQHFIQNEVERFSHPRIGTSPEKEGTYLRYITDPGEVEARMNSYRWGSANPKEGAKRRAMATPREMTVRMEEYLDEMARKGGKKYDGILYRNTDEITSALRGFDPKMFEGRPVY